MGRWIDGPDWTVEREREREREMEKGRQNQLFENLGRTIIELSCKNAFSTTRKTKSLIFLCTKKMPNYFQTGDSFLERAAFCAISCVPSFLCFYIIFYRKLITVCDQSVIQKNKNKNKNKINCA